MPTYKGSCHCQAVTFSVDIEPTQLIDCNCTVCTKKGIIHVPVSDDQFTLLTGQDDLSLYQFKSNTASHWFCRHCGIHPFGRPRADPSRYTVNARCLDEFESLRSALPTAVFDGQNHPRDQ